MKRVATSINRTLLVKELSHIPVYRKTNKANNFIYIFDGHEAPNLLMEIGRLRELSFRLAGGGTGNKYDIDKYDTMPHPYKQLIVWNPTEGEIVGGYRFFYCRDLKYGVSPNFNLSITDYFNLSTPFIRDYLPYSIELGRAFVQPAYQSSKMGSKSIFALDNLWDGLGAIVVNNPDVKYFYGKVTTYRNFNVNARNILLNFLHTWFPDNDNLFTSKFPIQNSFKNVTLFNKGSFSEDYVLLKQLIRETKENIPPLFNAYINLSPNMRTLGTSINTHLGDVDETAILLSIKDLFPEKVSRHINTYCEELGKL